jgi:hypothetical protein
VPTYVVIVRKIMQSGVEADSPDEAIEEAKKLDRTAAGFLKGPAALADDPTFAWYAVEATGSFVEGQAPTVE